MDCDRSFFTSNELSSVAAILETHQRPDGRLPFSPRRFTLDFSDGNCLVHLGDTLISCRTTAEQVPPHEDRPSEGVHTISVQSLLRIDDSFRRESIRELKASLHRTRALDLESLVVKLGELVWALRSDITILNNDGGLLPAMQLALVGSLLATKLPGPRGRRAVALHHLPIAVSFGFLENFFWFVDPTAIETALFQGIITIFVNVSGEVCGVHKIGGAGVPPQLIDQLLSIGMDVADVWHREILEQMGAEAPQMLKNLVKWAPVKSKSDGEVVEEGDGEAVHAERVGEEEEIADEVPASLLALFQ
jgi:exosome complex RNA-binding protein Rrp42 (RNase PH superfamily)